VLSSLNLDRNAVLKATNDSGMARIVPMNSGRKVELRMDLRKMSQSSFSAFQNKTAVGKHFYYQAID
jgi:hypothetical protein